MTGRYQKIVLTIIVGGSLFGIAFQHYVRGPRQRFDHIRALLQAKDWNGFANIYSDDEWRQTTWSRSALVSFLQLYVEPRSGESPELQDSELDFYGTPIHRVAIIDPATGNDLFVAEQHQVVSRLWSYSGGQVVFPLGWQEGCPTVLQSIRRVAPTHYPHSDDKDRNLMGSVSEYEFLIAERKRLEGIGIKHVLPARLGQPAKTIDDYLSGMRRAYRKVWSPFAKVDAKYSGRSR